MKSIVFILLCGVVAWTQATTECGCSALQKCVDTQKEALEATFNDCAKECNSAFGDAAAAVDACWKNITTTTAPYELKFENCIFNSANKVCAGSRRKRNMRGDDNHAGGGDEHGGDHEEHGGDDDEDSSDEDHGEGHDGEGGHREGGHREGGHGEDRHGEDRHGKGRHGKRCHDNDECVGDEDRRWGPLSKKMQPFQQCMMKCFIEKHNATVHENETEHDHEHHACRSQRRRQPHNPAVWWVMKCEKENNCTINKDSVEPALKTCFTSLNVSPTQFAKFKQSSCECLRGAFNISANAMTCEPSEKEGVLHPWTNGNSTVNAGRHLK